MKNYLTLLAFLGGFATSYAQTNIFEVNGNVGIGTASPTQKLVVNGGIGIVDGGSLHFLSSNGSNWANTKVIYRNWDGQDFIELLVPGNGANNAKLRMNANGNVGIGTATPGAKLDVNGNIRASEIKVEVVNWPDYVFAKDYQLPTLQETEKHIQENGHLPGMPSAKEIEANGVNLGEMNKKLLEKIEELTLYLIEMKKDTEKKLNDQNSEIQLLKAKLKAQK